MSSSVSSKEVFGGISFLIYAAITIVVVPRNLLQTFDYLGKNQLNEANRLAALLRSLGVFLYGLTIIIGAILRNFWRTPPCLQTVVFIAFTWKTAMAVQYLTFILHLHECYPNPPYNYICKTKTLWIISYLIIIFYVIGTLIGVNLVMTIGVLQTDDDDQFPYKCTYLLDGSNFPKWVYTMGGLMILWDIILSCGSMYAFHIAYDKAKNDPNFENSKYKKKTLKTGFKYKIIVGVSSLSKLVWILFQAFFQLPDWASIFAGVDFTISMISLIIMSPDYADQRLYQYLCYFCIKWERQMDKANESQLAKTIPTETPIPQQQTELAANQLGSNSSLNNMNEE